MTEERCNHKGCKLPIQNKKHKLCKIHIWEKNNPGKSYYEEQNRKNKITHEKMVKKQASKPKKPIVWKSLTTKPQKEIAQISKKQAKLNNQYSKERNEYMKDHPYCQVFGCTLIATELHHKKGRVGYADNWARRNGIKLTVDKRWFMSVCHQHHRMIEDHPAWAREMEYSLSRLENLDQDE